MENYSWLRLPATAVEQAARELLGWRLAANGVTVRLTEVEAYSGLGQDPASHAHRGMTGRNEVMFGPAGHLYTYFVYGMHVCANVVTNPDGEAGAVLLRAGEVLGDDPTVDRGYPARGPARLCRTLGITLDDDGCDLAAGPVTLTLAEPVASDRISTGPRVGLRRAADVPWRFWLTGEPSVSTYRPAAPRRRTRPSGDA